MRSRRRGIMPIHPAPELAKMSGLTPSSPRPTDIKLHQKSRELEIVFDDGKTFRFSCEFLRVYSPSAEVRGHGPGQEVLQVGKKNVEIKGIEPTGTYAVKLNFSDGTIPGSTRGTIFMIWASGRTITGNRISRV